MPLFEVEPDRPQIARGEGGVAEDVVEHNIESLLGEQVFTVSVGQGSGEPHLLALDAAGAPVIVELVNHLDHPALARALDHAGAAGRMTRAMLAHSYRGGADEFVNDFAAFTDSVPVKRTAPGRAGSRLVIVCKTADDLVLNAVDFLRQPFMPIEVLQFDLVHGEGGRRFIDVSPLVINPDSAPERPKIASARHLNIAPQAPGATEPVASVTDANLGAHFATGAIPRVSVVDHQESDGEPDGQATGDSDTVVDEPADSPVETPADVPADVQPVVVEEPHHDGNLTGIAQDSVGQEDATAAPPVVVEALPVEPLPVELSGLPVEAVPTRTPIRRRSRVNRFASGAVIDDTASDGPSPATGSMTIAAVAAVGAQPHDPSQWETLDPVSAQVVPIPVAEESDNDIHLTRLAESIGLDTPLVWDRPRRGQRFVTTLRADGVIVTEAGAQYRHPDTVARALSGWTDADGWNVWHLGGPGGPTLMEAYRARFE
ncbi:MAG: hypothetical protein LBB54_00195 [Cellulomonadaceae bacterium]|nr:hypothetical protein [Cellulomonadaceae bacterium]